MDASLIFIVDDEISLAKGLATFLEKEYCTRAYGSAREALVAMERETPDLVLLDIGMPGMDGMEALARIHDRFPDVIVVMITAFSDTDSVVAAMKQGAWDYVVKPLEVPVLEKVIETALAGVRMKREVKRLQERCLRENLPCFVGQSHAIRDMMHFVEEVAGSPDTPVLILGESGTGKELVAGALHYRSPNFKGPLVAVNCAAIPDELVESELFGYEEGAFSGAARQGKKGLVEAADGGTLFLDEIGDLSLRAQAKLLRFLETGEFYRVGGSERIQVRSRVVSATHRDLPARIASGDFREDLYYRISVVKIQIPSLNHRKADILPIARYFLTQFGEKFNKTFTGIDDRAEAALLSHEFRGNVRELKNMIELAALTAPGPELSCRDLRLDTATGDIETSPLEPAGPPPSFPEAGLDLTAHLARVESAYIRQALAKAGGNETRAASLVGLKSTTFRYRRRKYGIS